MEIKIVIGKEESEVKKASKAPTEIKSIKDLKRLISEENPRFSYGGIEFGAIPAEQEDDEEDSELTNDVTEGRIEGEQPKTPDDKASAEDNETRIKNSKNPTIVGKKMV